MNKAIICDLDNHEDIQLYINFCIVRDLIEIIKISKKSNYRLINKNTRLDIDSFITKVKKYEESKLRSYNNSNYKKRHGALIKILCPYGLSKEQKKLLIKHYTNLLFQKENLIYFAWLSYEGKGEYITLYIHDREYIEDKQPKVYKRNYYINDRTKKWCSKHSANAVLIHHAGEVQKDRLGNVKYEKEGFSAIKTRLFTYVEGFDSYIGNLKKILVFALQKLKIKYQKGKFFKKARAKYHYSYFVKNAIAMTNKIKCLIEHQLTNALQNEFYEPNDMMIKNGYDPEELLLTKKGKDIEQLYYMYRERFKKNSFHYKGHCYAIAFTRVDIIRENLELLYKVFQMDLNKILKGN